METNKTPLIAFAWASGLIHFGYHCPHDAVLIASSSNERELRRVIEMLATWTSDDEQYVPFAREARTEDGRRLLTNAFARSVTVFLNYPEGVDCGN
ncbi:host nuclease inhibitor protein [Salmonella enterica subsp. enterica serovar Telelkebir]|nr:host nuclease inhibitor protein [Salmonella enterica subsp. enterica serovar Telelkebir]